MYKGFILFWYKKNGVTPLCTPRSQRAFGIIGDSRPSVDTTGAIRGREASSGVSKWRCVSYVRHLIFVFCTNRGLETRNQFARLGTVMDRAGLCP